VPLLGVLRIAANQQREWYELRPWAWQRLRFPAILLLSVTVFGALALFPAEGRRNLAHFNGMIRAGLQASASTALAQPLQDPLVGAFRDKATPVYTLDLVQDNLNRYQIPYVPIGDIRPAVMLARFSNGWSLACLYISPEIDPFCRGIDNLEHFLTFGDDETDLLNSHGIYVPQH
jgi:hypothetical protein